MAITKKPSPYTILNNWLYDGNRNTEIPDEIVKDKSIGSQYLLYFFQGSPYLHYLNSIFNNFGIYQLDRLEIFKFIKLSIQLSGYRPKYLPRFRENKSKLGNELKKKYPYLKYDDVNLLVSYIDESDDKDLIYEMFGLVNSFKKRKTKKKEYESYKETDTSIIAETDEQEFIDELDIQEVEIPKYGMDKLLENFLIEEV